MTRSQKMSASLTVALAAIAAPVGFAVAQNAGTQNQQSVTPATTSLSGTLKAFNLNPEGDADALLIDIGDGKVTQVNFPPHAGTTIGQAVAVGDSVKVGATPAPTRSGATVYDLVTLAGKDGKEMRVAQPGEEATAHVEGTVKSLNYAREGEVNGAILDDGTFVHVGPREAEDLNLAVGQKLVVDGMKKSTLTGKSVIDATNVNGTEIERPAPGPKGERGAPGPKGERRAPGPKGEARPAR